MLKSNAVEKMNEKNSAKQRQLRNQLQKSS